MSSNPAYAQRLDRARAAMEARRVDALMVSVGADLPYLTGYEAMESERLTMLVLPSSGPATLVVPRLEAPRVMTAEALMSVRPWDETEDPIAIAAGLAAGAGEVAIGDRTWSAFLLGLQAAMPAARFTVATGLMAELRVLKDDGEVGELRAAAAAADRVAARLLGTPFEGRTERDLARQVAAMTVEEGHDSAAFAIVASGPNGASPHHEPGDRRIVAGDTVVVDFGGRLGGYHSDTTRTFSVGEPEAAVAGIYDVLRRAQAAAVAAVRPGVPAEDIDRVARDVIEAAGYGEYFVHRTGHGIGLEVHEHPYLVAGNREPLRPGMAFSVEPGIYLPGRFGMRIEDIVVVTADGAESLNRSSRRLEVVS